MVRLALIQMHCPKGEVEANLAAHEAQIRAAVTRGVGIICFPEMSITGYIDPTRRPDAMLALESDTVARFVAMTAGTDVLALAGLVEHNPAGKPFITQIAARRGALVAVYRKSTIPPDEAPWFAPGPGEPVVLPHEAGPIGLAICADIDNPEHFARLARAGARLVIEAAAPGLYGEQATRDWQAGFDWWRGECHDKLGRYARTHGLTIAVATQAGRTVDEDFPGGGFYFGPDGHCIAETGNCSPGVLGVEMSDEQLIAVRHRVSGVKRSPTP